MPDYLYRCEQGHATTITASMSNIPTLVSCATCGAMAARRFVPLGVNWGGIAPHAEHTQAPWIKQHIAGVDQRRDNYLRKKSERKETNA